MNQKKDRVMARDTHRKRLIYLHDELDMTWRKIAEMEEYKGIPAGSLCSFAKGNWEPKDLITRRKLGYKEPEAIIQYRNALGQFEER